MQLERIKLQRSLYYVKKAEGVRGSNVCRNIIERGAEHLDASRDDVLVSTEVDI